MMFSLVLQAWFETSQDGFIMVIELSGVRFEITIMISDQKFNYHFIRQQQSFGIN